MANENKQQLQIELPKEEVSGRYVNMAMIAHGPDEFFIDMILRGPNMPQARVQSRIIMTPTHAKELLMALQENVKRYEQNFGTIELPRPAQGANGIMDFPLPKGQA